MKIGFYGGKFFPMHKGHVYCIDTAARECDEVTVIIFVNGDDELNYFKNHEKDSTLSISSRISQVERICSLYPNVRVGIIDCNMAKKPDGTEDWDAETPLVRRFLPRIDRVYSSEPSYGDYFNRAYPEATHVIVDAERKHYPISSTLIRAMDILEEKEKWIV